MSAGRPWGRSSKSRPGMSTSEDARRYGFRGPTLWDPPEPSAGAKRLRAEAYVQRQVEALRRLVFPIHHL